MALRWNAWALTIGVIVAGSHATVARAAEVAPFEGEKSAWHDGFERYDFVLDEQSLAITPFKAPEGEKFGVHDPAKGQRRCIVVAPKNPAAGNPWSWQGCYWDHQSQAEVELLRRGFHIAYISANATLKPGKEWDAWYAYLTEKHGLSKKPAFIGMSRGGEYSYAWATTHPDKVSCIYGDNPGGNRDVLLKLGELAKYDVPLLHVCGSIDPILGKYSTTIEGIYHDFGGRISIMIKDGAAHHPHSLRDPTPIADFIEQSVRAVPGVQPDYLAGRIAKSSYYSLENSYRDFPKEGTYVTLRGPAFTACYDRYEFEIPGMEGATNVIRSKTAAAGKPWVYRAGFVDRDAVVDQALLAKGFHVVVGPVPYNADGPSLQAWNAVYKHLTDHGFAKKPVMEGAGRAAGEVYAWAIENPDKGCRASTPRIRFCAASCRKRLRSTISPRWRKPACRSCTFAAASIRRSTTRRASSKSVTRNLAGRSPSSLRKAKAITPSRRKTRDRSWISSSRKHCAEIEAAQ